jgi:hypothetical protein
MSLMMQQPQADHYVVALVNTIPCGSFSDLRSIG